MKQCRTCLQYKETKWFWKSPRTKDGLALDCIDCSKERWRKRVTPEKKEQYNERKKQLDDLNIQRYLLRTARKRAKKKGIECTIKPSDIILRDVCPILGVPLVKNRGEWSDASYSLDRIDSRRGYIPGNVSVISWRANYIKSTLSIEQVERLLDYMKGKI